jgi:DNA-directed RNA polymerase subunit K/omega|tara:strand:- start:5565 stop:5888 length:324 start_codon:yes stop_codon:yes gene_type:complete
MDYKKTTAPNSTITRDVSDFSQGVNVYEVLNVLAKRADQIGTELKHELDAKLGEFASTSDNLEEIFENREQIEISKFYERLPKPALIAAKEWDDKQIYYKNPNTEEK